jgi:hypothetical protein
MVATEDHSVLHPCVFGLTTFGLDRSGDIGRDRVYPATGSAIAGCWLDDHVDHRLGRPRSVGDHWSSSPIRALLDAYGCGVMSVVFDWRPARPLVVAGCRDVHTERRSNSATG